MHFIRFFMSKIKNKALIGSALGVLRSMRSYMGLGGAGRRLRVVDPRRLGEFLDTRSSFVAQSTLYGYLKTRMGTRYPSLFEDDVFLVSINQAKWQIWLACLSDLSVYAGGLVAHRTHAPSETVAELMELVVDGLLREKGVPNDAGPTYELSALELRERIAGVRWEQVPDDDTTFTASPDALVRWSPVIDELKRSDEPIIRNSIRFRWQEVRRELRRKLDAEAVVSRL